MIIYRGWGMLGILLPVFIILGSIFFFSDDGNGTRQLMLGSLIVSGILIIVIALLVNRNKDKKHDLYFIPLKIWGIIWLLVGVGGLVYGYLK
ncbi:hypothetical protein [Sinomicrobium sp. M5D2P17]